MQVDATHISGQQVAANAGLAAFAVAVVQQKQFEETLQRVSEKQSEIVDDIERRVEDARQFAASARGGVDIVVREDDKSSASPDTTSGGQNPDNRGGNVNLKV